MSLPCGDACLSDDCLSNLSVSGEVFVIGAYDASAEVSNVSVADTSGGVQPCFSLHSSLFSINCVLMAVFCSISATKLLYERNPVGALSAFNADSSPDNIFT